MARQYLFCVHFAPGPEEDFRIIPFSSITKGVAQNPIRIRVQHLLPVTVPYAIVIGFLHRLHKPVGSLFLLEFMLPAGANQADPITSNPARVSFV